MSGFVKMFAAIEFLRQRLSKGIPSQQITIFLAVAENPGITMPELCRLLDMPQGTVSRNVKVLSSYIEKYDESPTPKGYGVLRTQPDQACTHSLAVFLTGKGEVLLQELEQVLTRNNASADDYKGDQAQYDSPRVVSMMH